MTNKYIIGSCFNMEKYSFRKLKNSNRNLEIISN